MVRQFGYITNDGHINDGHIIKAFIFEMSFQISLLFLYSFN
jgi:hypothetical protein